MSLLYQFLTVDDLKDLTPDELEKLFRVLMHELHTSDDIRAILKNRVQQALDDLRQQRSPGTP